MKNNIVNMIWRKEELAGKINHSTDIDRISRGNSWNNLFMDEKWIIKEPAEEVIDFVDRYLEHPELQLRKRLNGDFKKIHDIGCGGGRHLFYLATKEFDVTGTDLSAVAIKYVDSELQKRNLKAKVLLAPMTKLPFDDEEFDISLSRATINHANLDDIKQSMFEIARTTRRGGLMFLTMLSGRSSEWRKGKEVSKDLSYIPLDGPEKGLIHTFLDASCCVALVEPFFRVEELYLSEHPPLITEASGLQKENLYFGSEYVIIGVKR